MKDLYIPIWMRIMCEIEKSKLNMLKLAYKLNISYSHFVNVMEILTKKKLLTMEKKGREYDIRMTKKGKKVSILTQKLYSLLYSEGGK